MFLPFYLLVLLLLIPIIVSILLIRLVESEDAIPRARVSASYWGTYTGTAKALPLGTIALHDPIADSAAPSILPPHAVTWHP